MDLIGVALAGEALVLLLLAIHYRSNVAGYMSLAFASISLPFLFIGA